MTEYTHRATFRIPAALRDDANALSLVLGESAADGTYITEPAWQDATTGEPVSVHSTVCTASWVGRATQELVAPDHAPDADLEAAGRAQEAVVIGTVKEPPAIGPEIISVVLGANGDDMQAHLAALNVVAMEAEEAP